MPCIKRLRRLSSALILVAVGILLTACADPSSRYASLREVGASFPRAAYEVKGKTRYDQIWIAQTIEAEHVAFGFKRPMRRPASLDAEPSTQKVVVTKPVAGTLITPAKPSVITVIKRKVRAGYEHTKERVHNFNVKVKTKAHDIKEKAKDKLHHVEEKLHIRKPASEELSK